MRHGQPRNVHQQRQHIITVNGPSLSTDLAQRAITIKLGKPVHTGDWLADTAKFIVENKTNIIAELLELLRQPIKPLQANTRWGNWETNVLCRLSNAERCQEEISSRRRRIYRTSSSLRDRGRELREGIRIDDSQVGDVAQAHPSKEGLR
jgi:hypothetical protein